ncbi:unnamed protein product [Didymodactylos carnosus]|uniref:ABC transporter domain-containing protein n=1 Tax=Didymodactylos carnosus TaxID=1234261 RepID=A0A815PRW3_9BILA|nr:unnamed protein product [Didymodactylos carnosus]CAF1452489.1 unnamed protein product [Didymodactylos carnosus]CAF4136607.1 unnamed protein product [Didymodactylos carnosus]CAF4325431.1 unnamed protein product [Didymodactylos carnosus]
MKIRHLPPNDIYQATNRILSLTNLKTDALTLSKDLSGGMKRRLSIGMSLIGEPTVLIFDEPTSGIDLEYRLFMDKDVLCEERQVRSHIQQSCQNIIFDRESVSELRFGIPRGQESQVQYLIDSLARSQKQLKIKNYGIATMTIEDVFLQYV